jgi:nitrite reductase/ring-hydroxylating ferredoxin subunit
MPHAEISIAEVPLNVPTRFEHEGVKLVILRTESQISAYEDVCPHAFWPLSEGTVRDGVLECPGHGWEFSVSSGRCLNAPAYCLTPVSLQMRDGTIRLEWEVAAQSSANK